ncbi:hypothetical protein Ddye_009275 [Dipteronia dyeriana]|uniref:Reverse transcriptase domain-containing protein n=1 Tax=Dipteronia dyeriana TaxID=168575 RepID=A0AAD9XBB0_9ROSI|nr:hypothetical protein Ddye_009275 [Dipteronia dyeriana]
MGFPERWVNLVLRCISSVSYSFKLNGEVCGNIVLDRGLKQGDPLSPYLFLIYVEDDSLLFTRANDINCREIRLVLDIDERALGHVINYNKSAMCMSPSISSREGKRMTDLIGGLGQIKGWGEKLLSVGGKDILIKAVIQSIPTYAMSMFQLPNGWISRPSTFKILSSPKLNSDDKVSCLISASGGWNVDFIKQNFDMDDVEGILSIPLRSGNVMDTVLWHYDECWYPTEDCPGYFR